MNYTVDHMKKPTDRYEHNKTDEEYKQEIRKLKQEIQELKDVIESLRNDIVFYDKHLADHVAWLKQNHQEEMKKLRNELRDSNDENLLRAIRHEQETVRRLTEENQSLKHLRMPKASALISH